MERLGLCVAHMSPPGLQTLRPMPEGAGTWLRGAGAPTGHARLTLSLFTVLFTRNAFHEQIWTRSVANLPFNAHGKICTLRMPFESV